MSSQSSDPLGPENISEQSVLDHYERIRRIRRKQHFKLIAIAVATASLSLYSFLPFLRGLIPEFPIQVASVTAGLYFSFFVFSSYVNGRTVGIPKAIDSEVSEMHDDSLSKILEKLSKDIQHLKVASESHNNIADLGNIYSNYDNIRQTLFEDLYAEINHKLDRKISKVSQIESIRKLNFSVSKRLMEELDRVNRKGTISLFIGTVSTLLGITLLTWFVFNHKESGDQSWLNTALQYGPRLSIIVFIQIFAFFFLRMYRSGLEDIKFYQNELTSIESRFIAIELSLMTNDTDTTSLVIHSLAGSDRNVVLNNTARNWASEVRSSENSGDYLILEKIRDILSLSKK